MKDNNFAPNDIILNEDDIILTFFTMDNYDKDKEAVHKELVEAIGPDFADAGTRALMQNYVTRTTFALIKVDGYNSWIAHSNNSLEPNAFNNSVYPFDRERVYPMQRAERKISFKTYY